MHGQQNIKDLNNTHVHILLEIHTPCFLIFLILDTDFIKLQFMRHIAQSTKRLQDLQMYAEEKGYSTLTQLLALVTVRL